MSMLAPWKLSWMPSFVLVLVEVSGSDGMVAPPDVEEGDDDDDGGDPGDEGLEGGAPGMMGRPGICIGWAATNARLHSSRSAARLAERSFPGRIGLLAGGFIRFFLLG
jgi:hypothetical protein